MAEALNDFLEKQFQLRAHGTTVRTEALAGLTTFLALAYIVFVQPAVLSAAGMDFGAVVVATCVSSALASLLMGVLANYPIAVAPAMGHNFFFAYAVVIGMGVPWRSALAAVAAAGLIFVATAAFGLRERLITALPEFLQRAIAAGIGLLVAIIGMEWAGLIVGAPGTLVTLGSLRSPPTLLALFGLTITAVLWVRLYRAAVLWGMLATTMVGLSTGLVQYQGFVSAPPSLAPTFLQLDLTGIFSLRLLPVIAIFFFLALFDSVGTLVGVARQAGLMHGGTLPRAREALLADALGTVAGAGLGTSTVTAYIESATGVAAGGRTGLTAIVTAGLLLLTVFFTPLVRMIGGGYRLSDTVVLYPIVAPALILVGALMMREVRHIQWDDPSESIPAFLTMVVMALAVSITEGIAFGFIAACVLKAASGRARELHWLIYVFAALFVLRYALLRA